MPALAVENMLDLIGGTPIVRLRHLVDAVDGRRVLQVRAVQPRRIAEGSHRALDDRGRGARGAHPTGRVGDRRADLGQHGRRAWRVVAAAKGYRLILTMPDNMSLERRALLQRLRRRGPPDAGGAGHEGRGRARARRSAASNPQGVHAAAVREPGQRRRAPCARPAPRSSPSSATASPDAFVHGVGTGGTITGVGQVLRAQAPRRAHRRRRAREERRAVGRPGGRAPHRRHRRRLRARHPRPLGAQRGAHHLRAGRPADEAAARPCARGCWSASRRARR